MRSPGRPEKKPTSDCPSTRALNMVRLYLEGRHGRPSERRVRRHPREHPLLFVSSPPGNIDDEKSEKASPTERKTAEYRLVGTMMSGFERKE